MHLHQLDKCSTLIGKQLVEVQVEDFRESQHDSFCLNISQCLEALLILELEVLVAL